MTQICANEMGCDITDVKTTKGDTRRTPYDNYSASSRTTYNCGNAVMLAARDCVRKLKEEVGRHFGLNADKVEIRGRKAYLKGHYLQEVDIPSLFIPVSFFNQGNWGLQQGTPVVGKATYCPAAIVQWDKNGLSPRVWNWFQYNACSLEVAVNEETGQIKVTKVASCSDTGNPINPALVKQQIIGGVHMAIGFSTMEEHLFNKDGKQSNATFSDYRLPGILEMPENAEVYALINPDSLPDGPYGAKGMAESVTIPVGPAIAEAVYKAVGVRVTGYPMTAERILALIKEKKAKEACG